MKCHGGNTLKCQMKIEPIDSGEDRFIDFNRKFLHEELAEVQKEVLRAVANHRRVLIVSGNGVGKSYIVALLKLAFLYSNVDSTVMGTSGSYQQYIDTMWRPLENMHRHLEALGMPGETKGGNSPMLEISDDWFINVVSPRDPEDLEGRHASKVLVVIEEADKEYVTEQHFESAGSSVTDSGDRMIAIANPPSDEGNVVYDKMQSNRWHTVQFSSFDSHNIQYDIGNEDYYIEGLVDLPTIADDWESWHPEEWPEARVEWNKRYSEEYPGVSSLLDRQEQGEMEREDIVEILRPGFEQVRQAHEERTDLSENWYRRRAGIIPPDTAQVWRPFTLEDVTEAVQADLPVPDGKPVAVGYDVARQGGDWNVIAARFQDRIHIIDRWQGVDHNANYRMITAYLRQWDEPPFGIDAQGEGSATADRIRERHPTRRYKSGTKASQTTRFKYKWDESLWQLGQFLKDGGKISGHDKIEEELAAAAREIEIEENFYASRNDEVMEMTPKEAVEERLGRSPDILDAVLICQWVASGEVGERNTQRLTW